MTDHQATLTTAEGETIPLTEDADAIDTYATGLTVSLQRQIQPQSYEHAQPFASIRAEVRPALALDADGAIDALRDQAERLGRVVNYQVGNQVRRYREDVNGGGR